MDKLVVTGGVKLQGSIAASGSKNSALPALAATLLTADPVILHRIPMVRDIGTMKKLLEHAGATLIYGPNGEAKIQTHELSHPEAPYEIVKTMRASSLVLGPMLARAGEARVSLPGGCAIGSRPIDLHMMALERLGARITQEHGYVVARADGGLRGAPVHFDKITVTGTEDIMMAATLAKGETVLNNAAREPEVVDLADLLTKMGAKIEGAGTSTIRIQGVTQLHGTEHSIIADRIEVGTYLAGAAITKGDVTVTDCVPEHLDALLSKLQQVGLQVETTIDSIRVSANGKLRAIDIETKEHPGFPTDLQAQYMALMTQAEGITMVTENIFENRFMQVMELVRMGANIRVDGRRAIVAGPAKLSGSQVQASDLRASASLILAGLVADGETVIDRVYHLDRGYEKMEQKLATLGATIRREA
jgi:UDP-N-acetylglucosamine 1-carboxyvinyltransferase